MTRESAGWIVHGKGGGGRRSPIGGFGSMSGDSGAASKDDTKAAQSRRRADAWWAPLSETLAWIVAGVAKALP